MAVLLPATALDRPTFAQEPPKPKADTNPTRAIDAKSAIVPAAPILPADVVAAMQERRFTDAAAALQKLAAASKIASDIAYFALIQGIALRLDGKSDQARAALSKAIEAEPQGIWAPKLRLELAGVELAAGNQAEAEALARIEAENLLSSERKDRLAEVYHAFAKRLLKPDNAITPADPNTAYELLVQARSLAKGEVPRARLLFEMAAASTQANNFARALQDYTSYLKEYPKGADHLEARFQLAASEQSLGSIPQARLRWSDLARELDVKDLPKTSGEIRARALFAAAHTYGIPSPGDDTSLNLGIAALRRYLDDYPSQDSSVTAAYEIGLSYLNRGKSEQALDALTRFLKEEGFKAESDETKRILAQLSMTATFQVAQVLQGQQKFDEAIAAWKGYLSKFPNGPQSADSQRAILDTQLMIAEDHKSHDRHDEARAAWSAFVAQNPLDGRVPEVLFKVGESHESQKNFEKAIAAWQPLLSRFPAGEPAAHAQFQIAAIEENERGDLEKAIELYKRIGVDPWRTQALERVRVMEAIALNVNTPRTFRSGETAHLEVETRNLEKLTFSAYKLNAESYFRKKRSLENVESLDISLVAPDAEWTVNVPKYARYKPIDSKFDLPKLELPGVYVVKVTDEKHLQATTLVIGSDIDAIIKTSLEQLLVFVQDMKTGLGRPNARVLVGEGDNVVFEGKTGPDGVLLQGWPAPKNPSAALSYLVIDGASVAGTSLSVPAKVAQGIIAKAYLYTDRPAYRPGQEIAIKGIIREVADGQYANVPKAVYKLEVIDSRGRQIVGRPVTLSDFGTFQEELTLEQAAPVGDYRIRVYQPGKSDFSGGFLVQSYQLEKIDLSFDLKQLVFFRGETISTDLIAKYQYGAPVAAHPVAVQLPDGRLLQGVTDAAGKFHVEFSTEGLAEEQSLTINAQLPQDNVAAAANCLLVIRALALDVKTSRDVYLNGETFQVKVRSSDPLGKPLGESLSVALMKILVQKGRTSEREMARKAITTDLKTGEAVVSLRADDEDGGDYLVRVSGTDRFKNPIVTDRRLTISGKDDSEKLRILADRQTFKVGEEASVNLHNKGKTGTTLLTWEGDRVLSYKLMQLVEGDNPLKWAVDGSQFPNFTLNASRMTGEKFEHAAIDVRVERDLQVTLKPVKASVAPGEEVEVDVTTVDQLGRPVSAELSLALVDRSLLRIFGDKLPPIGPYFYDQTRTGSFETDSTNTFRYDPATTPVAQAVVEESEVGMAQALNRIAGEKLGAAAKDQVALGMPAPEPGPAPAGAAFMEKSLEVGRMMGGMGGRADGDKFGVLGSDAPMASPAVVTMNGALSDFAAKESDSKRDPTMGRFSKQKSEKKGGNTSPRERFAETAYWNPGVVTDKEGKAHVTFKAPMALSDYQFTARGVTGSDTLVGQTTASLMVKKDFFVDLKIPSRLTQGDKPRFIAQVHHVGVVGPVDLKLSIYAGDHEQVYPKTIDVKADGVEEILFDPFEVPDAENVRITLNASAGEGKKDDLVVEVPVRPWGVQAVASASGTASSDATVFVGLPAGRTYENPEMLVVVSPTMKRILVELALGRDFYVLNERADRCIFPPIPNTVADRASELLAATSALKYLSTTKAAGAAPEASRLAERIRGLVSELVSLQGDDGGWPWVASASIGQPHPSDRLTSARALWALATAEPLGYVSDAATLERASNYLTQAFAQIPAGDQESRAVVLHALSTRKKANFETANSLNRIRQSLSDTALASLALTFANLDRVPLAGEILDILSGRVKTEASQPGSPPKRYWGGTGSLPSNRSAVETTALVALAFAKARPQAPELSHAIEWLLAHRSGFGWQPLKAKGPALAALSEFYSKAAGAEDRYNLTVVVNDTEVYRTQVVGANQGKAILVPTKALKAGAKNRVRFDVEGRGTIGFTVTLTGFTRDFAPDQNRANRTSLIDRRVYLPADPEFGGKTLPTGFSVVINPTFFENHATQVPLGGRARVQINAYRNAPANLPEWEREFLVLEEHLPAGATFIEGSLVSNAIHHTIGDGVLTLYFSPDQWPGLINYDVYGYLPGEYRALPASIRNAYELGRGHLGNVGSLKILSPGEKSTDPYKPTPDELLARGRALFEANRYAEAAIPLEEVFNAYTLRDDIAKDAARMLLLIHIKEYDARKVVQYFEVVKEKAPELVLSFDDLLVIGRAYRDIKEYERAFLVWRGVAEASYLEDARVGEVLRQRGKTLEGMSYLISLWREYPNSASIESDFFALSQVLAKQAEQAFTNPAIRRELAEAGVTRSELLLQSIRLIQVFLSQSPTNPMADEASLGLVGNFLDLEQFPSVVKLAARFAKLYPKSTFLDSFQYSEALGEFHLGHYGRAVEVAETIAKATYKDAAGVDQPSPNKWQAVYILGQIFDARQQPGKAIEYYKQVAQQFTDAADAIRSFTRKDLKIPEVSVVKAPTAAKVAAGGGEGGGLPALPPIDPKAEPTEKPEVKLDYRNIAEADVKVYPVDLMRLYLTRRNLDEIAGIDLAGITPLHEATIDLGKGEDYADKIKSIDLPLKKEGAYLVMVRGENLYTSGIVLVSALELEVLEEPGSGRVRVTVRDANTKEFVSKVQVKVIGNHNRDFISGETDLRGVFVAEGVSGEAAAVARKGKAQYAFYRGKTNLGPKEPAATQPQPGVFFNPNQSLDQNLRIQNGMNRSRQIERLENRYKAAPAPMPGNSQGGAAAGGFR